MLREEHGDVIRESVRAVARELMETEVSELIGAEHGERTDDRATHRNEEMRPPGPADSATTATLCRPPLGSVAMDPAISALLGVVTGVCAKATIDAVNERRRHRSEVRAVARLITRELSTRSWSHFPAGSSTATLAARAVKRC